MVEYPVRTIQSVSDDASQHVPANEQPNGFSVLRWAAGFLGLFVVLLVWRWSYLTRPSYEDLAWLWQEASFLADSNFDYYFLWTEEPRADQVTGGGRAYLISIGPTLIAVLMKLSPTTTGVFIVYHLFYFACASALLLMIYGLAKPYTGRLGAFLATLAVLTTPAFSVRIEMIGLDLPMVVIDVVAILLMRRDRYIAATATSLLAYFIKVTSLLVTASIVGYLLLVVIFPTAQSSGSLRRRHLWGLAVATGTLLVEAAIIIGTGMMQIDNRWNPPDYVSAARLTSATLWVPDLVAIFFLALLLTALIGARSVIRVLREGGGWSGLRERLARSLENYEVAWLAWFIVGSTVIAMLQVLFMPRYLTIIVPLLYLIVAILMFRPGRLRLPAIVGLAGLIVFNLLNAHGEFLKPLIDIYGEEFARTNAFSPRASVGLERSLEYRADHKSTIDALKLIETRYGDHTIFADDTYVAYMIKPRLGYVSRPLDTCEVDNYPLAVERYLELTATTADGHRAPPPLFMVGGLAGYTLQGPGADDEILYTDEDEMDVPLIIFRHDWPAVPVPEAEREAWYFDHLCPGEARMQSPLAIELAQQRAKRGEIDRARQTLRIAVDRHPNDIALLAAQVEIIIRGGDLTAGIESCEGILAREPNNAIALGCLASILSQQGVPSVTSVQRSKLTTHDQPAEAKLLVGGSLSNAERAVEAALRRNPDDPSIRFLEAAITLRRGNVAAADRALRTIVRIAPSHAPAQFILGAITFGKGQLDEAAEHLRSALDASPRDHRALALLGTLQLQRGDLDEAAVALEASLAVEPEFAWAHYELGLVGMQQQQLANAEEHLTAAYRLEPKWSNAINALGVLYARSQRPIEARRLFEQCLRWDAGNVGARNSLAALDR